MSFISCNFHWDYDKVMALDHGRRRWCEEISSINSSLNPSDITRKLYIDKTIPPGAIVYGWL